MNILITGAAGFLGSHLVEHFLKEGHNVIGVDNLSGGSLSNLSFLKNLGFETKDWWALTEATDELANKFVKSRMDGTLFVDKDNAYQSVNTSFCVTKENQFFIFDKMNCSSFEDMNLIMKDVDVVYHCACLPHEGLSVFSPSLITESVYSASVAVFSAAIAQGVKRIVYMSSMSRYGHPKKDAAGPLPFWEELTPAPVDPYGIAKVAAEETLKCLCETHGVEYTILVPHNIIGTRQNYTDPHRNVASIMMNRLKQGKDVIIYGDGTQTRCFSPVTDNICSIARTANLTDKAVVGQVINIGPDRGTITISELSDNIYQLAGRVPSAIHYPDRPREVKHASCSADKARQLLGYVEQQSLNECLRQMWEAIPDGGAPFVYEGKPLEIINDKTPKTWTDKLI